MSQFQYSARTADGRSVMGTVDANDETSALRILSEKFELVTSVTEIAEKRKRGLGSFRFTSEDLLTFTEQLSEMLESGIPLTGAMEILLQDTDNPARNAILGDVLSTLNAGSPLSVGLRQHPTIFSSLYRSMVEAGEASGRLPLMLSRLSIYLERSESMKRQLRASLVYPLIVVCFAFIVVTVVLVFGVPRLSAMYGSLGAELPVVTRIFVDICTFIATYWYAWLALGVAAFYGISNYLKRPGGLIAVQNLSARLFGPLMSNVAMARFCRTLATLYTSAIPLTDALEMVSHAMGTKYLEHEVLEVRNRVMNGEPLAQSMRRSAAFPTLLVGMVSAGQEAGALDRMLIKLADIYESKVDAGLRAAVAALEPLVIIFVGLLVGGTLLVLGLPFLNIGGIMQ